MQIFSKKRDIFKNRRDAGQSQIGTCGHFKFEGMLQENTSKFINQIINELTIS